MHEKLKHLIKISKELFSLDYIDKLSKNTGFIKRKGKLSADAFMAFNIFSSEDMCFKSLSTLCTRFESQFGILMSPQSLNERFNDSSVKFMQEIFNTMLIKQNEVLSTKSSILPKAFNRILVTDSTVMTLPREFYSEFKGAGNENLGSAIKIQLQYDILTGSFTCCEIQEGIANDANYTKTISKHIKSNDLSLADLGYYKSDFLKKIHNKKAFYISKIKNNTAIYIKNPNPERYKTTGNIKKSTEFIKMDIYKFIEELDEGETIELNNVYIGSQKKLKPRLVITKLSKKYKEQRTNRLMANAQKHRGTVNSRSTSWNELNAYITNVKDSILKTEEIHLFYSLRWQIEL
ncbi:IS4 family transposase, partial [Clostridium tarantellae]